MGTLSKFERWALAGWFSAWRADAVLKHNLWTLQQAETPPLVAPQDLTKYAEQEGERRKRLEEKARTNLFTVTISSTLIFAGFGLIATSSSNPAFRSSVVLPIALFVAVMFFAAAGWCAVRALQIGAVYGLSPEQELQYGAEEQNFIKAMSFRLNQIDTNRRANWVTVSFDCIRNAVICLLLFVLIATAALLRTPMPARSQGPGTPVVIVNSQSAASLTGFSALTIGNIALLVVGAILVLFARSTPSKAVGVATLAAGLIGQGYFVKQLKIDKLFGVEKLLSLEDPRLNIDIKRTVSQALTNSGLEHIGEFPRFAIGRAELKLANFDAETEIDRLCAVWNAHGARGQDGVLLIIGSSDRLRLHGRLMSQYEANVGLAQARAEEVKNHLLGCINSPGSHYPIDPVKVLTLATGPATTPQGAQPAYKSGFPDDRRVDVWAFWTPEKRAP